ncbi:unnamed protein product [Bursaphelenchus xylophilus]|uniref:(pine wood nematode) hypothetical protein n=1 Tax=Bursaphelenchus xylophilus TaxID=6326 RepID=A0A1I7SLC5_BURXY|nr:unnamed protein product [Bursaphelenchus xylophilus]CAG9129490.1 unnamed protein product [Bursaphelenchus xylophilus]
MFAPLFIFVLLLEPSSALPVEDVLPPCNSTSRYCPHGRAVYAKDYNTDYLGPIPNAADYKDVLDDVVVPRKIAFRKSDEEKARRRFDNFEDKNNYPAFITP